MADFGSVDPVAAATQMIRDYCGWHIAPVEEETLVLDGTGTNTLLLPSRRVVQVSQVLVRDEPLDSAGYEWSAIGALRRLGGVWPEAYRSIEVTLEHGFNDMFVLADIVDSVAARIRLDPSGMIARQGAGTQSVSFGGRTAQGGGGHGLLGTEKDMLEPYRLNWGP